MKNKTWLKLESINDNGCKHENLVCGDCGSQFFRKHRWTKAKEAEIRRLVKGIKEAEERERALTTE